MALSSVYSATSSSIMLSCPHPHNTDSIDKCSKWRAALHPDIPLVLDRGGSMASPRLMAVDPEKAIVLYPSYFDSRVPRDSGRRVSKKDAVEAPTARMIYDSVRALDLDCILELEKAYPRFWYRKEGRVLVEPKMSKTELISKVTAKLKGLSSKG